MWIAAGSNSYEVSKAIIQAKMLSGQYRTEKFCRFWSNNRSGVCLAPECDASTLESIHHVLISCPQYETVRNRLKTSIESIADQHAAAVIRSVLDQDDHELLLQFLLDCSSTPVTIEASQTFGKSITGPIFHFTRTWCFSVHRERLRALGRWGL